MWDRWQRGESLHDIARLFDRNHSAIQGILVRTGGIRPPPRARSRLALSLSEREEISRGIVAGRSMRSIAASLARAASSVNRELGRNAGRARRNRTLFVGRWPTAAMPRVVAERHPKRYADCGRELHLATIGGRSRAHSARRRIGAPVPSPLTCGSTARYAAYRHQRKAARRRIRIGCLSSFVRYGSTAFNHYRIDKSTRSSQVPNDG